MKVHDRVLWVIVALALLASACSGGSEEAPGAEPVAEQTVAEVATAEPTAAPIPEVSDDELIAAAVAQLEADFDADPGPADLTPIIAYDVLDTAVSDDGIVTVTICSWKGDSIFDNVRDATYDTTVDADGAISARHLTTPLALGDCLNTELIERALAAAQGFDDLRQDFRANPTSLEGDPRAQLFMTPNHYRVMVSRANDWIANDLEFPHNRVEGPLEDTRVADILWRRLPAATVNENVELVFCRPMNPLRGAYRDGVLVDDERGPDSPGIHSIDSFELELDAATSQFQVAGNATLIWSDCLSPGDWPAAANGWRPNDIELTVLSHAD